MKRINGFLVLSAVVLAAPTITGCEDESSSSATRPPAPASVPASVPATVAAIPTATPPATGSTPDTSVSDTVSVLSTADLPSGPAPRIAYAYADQPDFLEGDWRLVRPDGATTPLPEATMGDFVPFDDGGLVAAYGTEAGGRVAVIAADGAVTTAAEGLAAVGLVTSPDHSIVGYLDDDHALTSVEDEGARAVRLGPVPRSVSAAALLGSGTCQEQEPEGGGCTAFLNGTPDTVRYTTSHGITDELPGLVGAVDANDSFEVVGLTRTGAQQCGAMLSAGGTMAWQVCGYAPDSFSPDGRHVLATDSVAKTGDVGGLAILDTDGDVEAAWTWDESPTQRITDLTWEDSRHVLAVVDESGSWSVLRLGVDGSVERAVGPVAPPRGDDYAPYLLPLT